MQIQRLRTRIIIFFVALLALVQLAAFALANAANSRSAHAKVVDELDVGQRVFARLLTQNSEKLTQAARVLAGDFAFREAVATHDVRTIESALFNHGARIGASAMMFIGLDGEVVADTIQPQNVPRRFDYSDLLRKDSGNATNGDLKMLAGHSYQLVAVPVLAPLTIGWVVVGLPVDDDFARDLRQLTTLGVSFMLQDREAGWRSLASTLSDADESRLLAQMPRQFANASVSETVRIAQADHQVRIIPLSLDPDRRIVAVLYRSLADALAAFDRLRKTLLALAFASVAISICGSIAIALNITRPLSEIARAAVRIQQGDYSNAVRIHRADEIGSLAASLNHMREGIAQRELRILTLAYQDPLTRLANRSKFSEELTDSVSSARATGEPVSILMMDLDRFKYVNDALGHAVGDHVLEEVASRLRGVLQDPTCIARLGGDEFAILLKHPESGRAVQTAQEIISTLEQPILYQGQPLDVGTSIGIANFPEHGQNAQTLVRNADIAMYVAKRSKRGVAVYDPDYDSNQKEHLSLLGELRRAVEGNELCLYYQPKVALESQNVSSVEALLRWNHPQRGVVSPAHFIPFAEHTGYIKVLTQWVLGEAIRQCGEWMRNGLRLQISVNISARDLMNRELPDRVAELLQQHGVPAVLLCLEVTESGFMEDPAHAQKVLDRLAALGLRLSIDDYGTGYSSLSYIMKLPVQELKIDRSFISRMVANPGNSTIVRSTIELGHSLGMKVVAEGVEDVEGWNLLRELGCDDAQGFYMSPPLQAAALVSWIRKNDAAQQESAHHSHAQRA
ncbi:MAG: putative bifunctional diguanylate cyclase/phosphodiesterase [Steroidobacteraceae bacterium]